VSGGKRTIVDGDAQQGDKGAFHKGTGRGGGRKNSMTCHTGITERAIEPPFGEGKANRRLGWIGVVACLSGKKRIKEEGEKGSERPKEPD